LDDLIDRLPPDYAAFKRLQRDRRRFALADDKIWGELAFVEQCFHFRYVNVYEYLQEYSTGRDRKIDLMVAHLVDFDWPLGAKDPHSTTTSLRDQIRIMERISQLTGGRVLCFAPFDPMKEVAYQQGLTPESSFQNVQDAVNYHGFIGAKIYPPMGFAPYGNATLDPVTWNKPWIPAALHRSDLGQLLDDALAKFYSWCVNNGVPIMGHSSTTNGASDDLQNLASAAHWASIPKTFPGIRINLGHFGDNASNGKRQEKEFAGYMDNSDGRFLYADAAYFSEVLSEPAKLKAYLASLLSDFNKPDAPLSQRLMYGTDWEMIVREGRTIKNYLLNFEDIIGALDRPPVGGNGKLSNQFFGANAATFLGLGLNRPNRLRLDRYYGLGPKPAWMTKVDRIPVA
jgi:predicted TIM-barrel fold metal-dependent hydrolase